MVKVRVPPSWRSSRTPGNFHTVTILFAHVPDPANNPLLMGAGLEQLLCWHCTCKAGLRTAASCTHRNGVLILLCATQCCDSAKVQESLYVDTARSAFCGNTNVTNITPTGQTPTSLLSLGHPAPTLLATRLCCIGCSHDLSTPLETPGPTQLVASLLGLASHSTLLRWVQHMICNALTPTMPLLFSQMVSLCPTGWFPIGQAGMANIIICSKLVVQELCLMATTVAL